jgi:hypothetical protein
VLAADLGPLEARMRLQVQPPELVLAEHHGVPVPRRFGSGICMALGAVAPEQVVGVQVVPADSAGGGRRH